MRAKALVSVGAALLVASPLFATMLASRGVVDVFLAYAVLVIATLGHGLLTINVVSQRFAANDVRTDAALRWGLAVGTALGALFAMSAPPLWSDDVYRYLAEGQMSAAGLWPLSYPLSSPKVAWIIAPFGELANHPEVRGIYPPVAQALFWVTSRFAGYELLIWRAMALGALSVGAGVLYRTLRDSMQSTRLAADGDRGGESRASLTALLFVSQPLVLVSAIESAHVEIFALTFVLLAWASWRRGGVWVAGLCVALAAGIKFYPLLILVALPWRAAPRSSVQAAFSALLVTSAWVGVALLLGGRHAFGSLGNYVENWSFNGPVYTALQPLLEGLITLLRGEGSFEIPLLTWWNERVGSVRYYDGVASQRGYVNAESLAATLGRALWLIVALVAAVWSALHSLRPTDMARRISTLFALLWLFSPVVHPWYLLWVLPGMWSADTSSRTWALWWAWTVPFAYFARASALSGSGWALPSWLFGLELGLWALLALYAYRQRGSESSSRPAGAGDT